MNNNDKLQPLRTSGSTCHSSSHSSSTTCTEQQQLTNCNKMTEVPANNNIEAAVVTKKPPIPNSLNLALPILRVEQLKVEGTQSPQYTSDSDVSDSEILTRLGEFVQPSDELCEQIIQQIEYYFSDENIVKDAFLLKHARRNKEGYVNLKLITSFKKMKSLTKDFRQVAWAINKLSKFLVVNEQGNKVRRTTPIPEVDETVPSRTVLAMNLLDENPTMESISSMFRDCGDIELIRILRPGKPLPADIKKPLSKHPEVGNITCAVIEFENHQSAQKAMALFKCEGNESHQEVKVVTLASASKKAAHKPVEDDSESEAESKHKKRNKKKTHRSTVQNEHEGMSSGSEGDFRMPQPRSRNSSFGSDCGANRANNVISRSMLSPSFNSSNNTFGNRGCVSPTSERFWSTQNGGVSSNSQRRRSAPHPMSPLVVDSPKVTPKSSPRASPKPSPKSSPRASPEMRRRANSGGARSTPDGGSTSPWVQRRLAASREMSPLAKGNSTSPGGRPGEHVIRQPKGPDGIGFYNGKGRGAPLLEIQ